MSGPLGLRDFLYARDAIGLARRELAAARTAFDAMRVAKWAIDRAAREFALGTDDGDCNGTQYQRCAAEAIGRAIDLCWRAEEALAVADLAGKSGPAFRALESAALQTKHRFGAVQPFRKNGDQQCNPSA